MCGDAWIPKSSLTSWRPLGEGAFATVQHCLLKQENGPAVCLLTDHLPDILFDLSSVITGWMHGYMGDAVIFIELVL